MTGQGLTGPAGLNEGSVLLPKVPGGWGDNRTLPDHDFAILFDRLPDGEVGPAEQVKNRIETEKAFNLTGGPTQFEFTVEFKFSVTYV